MAKKYMHFFVGFIMNKQSDLPKSKFLNITDVFLQNKVLILVVALLFTGLSGLFIFNHKPSYEVRVLLKSPTEKFLNDIPDIQPIIESDHTLTEVRKMFFIYLNSTSVRQLYFRTAYLPSLSPTLLQKYSSVNLINDISKRMKVIQDLHNKEENYTLSVNAVSLVQAMRVLNQYVDFINKQASQRFYILLTQKKKTIESSLSGRIQLLKNQSSKNADENNINSTQFLIDKLEQRINFIRQIIVPTEFNFYHYKTVKITSLAIDDKLKTTLIIGTLGGLLMGFFTAVFRIGLKHYHGNSFSREVAQ